MHLSLIVFVSVIGVSEVSSGICIDSRNIIDTYLTLRHSRYCIATQTSVFPAILDWKACNLPFQTFMLYMLIVKQGFFGPREEKDVLTRKISYFGVKIYSLHSSSGAIQHGRHPKMWRTSGLSPNARCAIQYEHISMLAKHDFIRDLH